MATYNYKNIQYDTKHKCIGFIAQDIENTKVANILLRENIDSEGKHLSYDISSYISVLGDALSTAINKIEMLRNEINELKSSK